jgi:cation-transporting ATPase 13A1
MVKYIHIFSRTSPNQKDFIVSMLNKEGHITMMCGDGTNDVGSLKRAHIGLAIVNNKEPSRELKVKRKTMSMWIKPSEL